MFIQLFANDNVIFDIVKKLDNMIHVKKNTYDFDSYLEDINFISSISD